MARTKGATNKPKLITWAGTERDPAPYIAKVMMDEMEDPARRLTAATSLMPYVHRKQPMDVEADLNASGVFEVIIRRSVDGAESATG